MAFTWLKQASTMHEVTSWRSRGYVFKLQPCEVGNASKKGSTAAVSLGYLVTVLMLLHGVHVAKTSFNHA